MVAHIISAVLGLWLMVAPVILQYRGVPENIDRIIGPLIFTLAFIAISEYMRGVRKWYRWLGVALVVAPFIAGYPLLPLINSFVVGAAVVILSFFRGEVADEYGGGWSVLWNPEDKNY